MMTHRILADVAASVSELKANPLQVMASAEGAAVAILNRNQPAFYCIPPLLYEQLLDQIEDYALLQLAQQRLHEPSIAVNFDEL